MNAIIDHQLDHKATKQEPNIANILFRADVNKSADRNIESYALMEETLEALGFKIVRQ